MQQIDSRGYRHQVQQDAHAPLPHVRDRVREPMVAGAELGLACSMDDVFMTTTN